MTAIMTLTQQQLDAFWTEGYLRIGKLFDGDELETLRREYDAEFAKAESTGSFRNLAEDGDATAESDKGRMLQIINMYRRNPTYHQLIYDERILDLVEDIIGPNIQLFHDQALWKPAGDGGAVFWHQDNAYWKCRPATLVSCWLTLDDVVRENGAMQVIPGSHLKPVQHGSAGETTALQEIKDVDESKAKVIELEAGGVMLHHCQTLHYTQPNETDRQRRAFAIHFMPPGTDRQNGDERIRLSVGFEHPMLRARI